MASVKTTIQDLSGAPYNFNNVCSIGFTNNGSYVWVGNNNSFSITQMTSDGNFLKYITEQIPDAPLLTADNNYVYVGSSRNSYSNILIFHPLTGAYTGLFITLPNTNDSTNSIMSDGTHLWVASWQNNNLYQYSNTGVFDLQQTYNIPYLSSVFSDGVNAWVSGDGGGSSFVTQIDIANLQILNTFSNATDPSYNFGILRGGYSNTVGNNISSNKVNVAVANYNNSTVTIMDALSGAYVNNISIPNHYPQAVSIDSQYLWVASSGGNVIYHNSIISMIYPNTSSTVIKTFDTGYTSVENCTISIVSNGTHVWNNGCDLGTGQYSMTLITLIIPCFKEDTKILTDRGYLPIQDLKKGDLVKTVKHGFQPIWGIGKRDIHHDGSQEREQNQLYVCSQDQYPEIFEDLVITGCHSILVPYFKDEAQWLETEKVLGKFYTTDDYKRLPACVDERAKVYDTPGNYTVYHIALEHTDYYMNYGIFANGLLVETCSKRYLSECSGMELS
jgi:hypothetical protein